jgi:hypothetical protein
MLTVDGILNNAVDRFIGFSRIQGGLQVARLEFDVLSNYLWWTCGYLLAS